MIIEGRERRGRRRGTRHGTTRDVYGACDGARLKALRWTHLPLASRVFRADAPPRLRVGVPGLCAAVSLSAAVKRVGRARRITQTSIRLPISVKNYFTPSSAWTKAPKRTRGETRERERIYILLFSYLKFRFLSIFFSVNRCSFLARVQKLKQ